MDLQSLPLDTAAMLRALRPWVECESPTFDPAAVDRMMAVAAADFAALGAAIQHIPGTGGFGGCVRCALPHAQQGGPGVLVLGHLDTVHPTGTLAALPWREADGKVWGPGIQDMKGGVLLALHALGALARAGVATPQPVTVLLTSDEEVGSPSTRALIEAEAARHRTVLVPEPAHADGGVTTGRYAIARYGIRATGRPSHAGWALHAGRSAIRAMARHIGTIEDMTGPDCTFSVGVVRGGQWVNCVASVCEGEVLSMAKRQADLDAGVARMMALNGETFEVRRGVTRPVWEPTPATLALHARAAGIAQALGFALPHASAGGGSDGNFTGAMGIPTLDGLGVEGAGLHTLDEHIVADSLPRRGRLMAGLLAGLD